MMHLAVENSPVEAAWAAFDTAALRLHALYQEGNPTWDSPAESEARRELAHEVSRLWREWQALFLADDDTRPAA